MPYKNREVQPEFFVNIEDKKTNNLLKKHLFRFNFTTPISVTFDNLIVIIIVFLMFNLMIFVFGMEKGKLLAKLDDEKNIINTQTNANKETIKTPATTITKNDEGAIRETQAKKDEEIIETPVEKKSITRENVTTIAENTKSYVIQLVSCRDNDNANKTLSQIKAAGYNSFIKKQGNYFVIYSGLYADKKAATVNMNQLKKKYKDCFVNNYRN